MSRQKALDQIWRRLLVIFLVLGAALACLVFFGGNIRVPALVLLSGNVGAYVSIHRGLGALTDDEVSGLAESWYGLVVPSFIGGILAFVMYMLCLSKIIASDLFPAFVQVSALDSKSGFDIVWGQDAQNASDYAKLFFWSFVAGFNQSHVVDLIESIRSKTKL